VELLKEIAPKISRVTIIFNPDTSPYAMLFYRSAEAAGQKLAVQTVMAPVHDPAGIEASLMAAGRKPGGGVIIPPDSFMPASFKLIVELATRYNVPSSSISRPRAASLPMALIFPTVSTLSFLCRPHPPGRETSRSSRTATHKISTCDQPSE